jgi:hypothetical protein
VRYFVLVLSFLCVFSVARVDEDDLKRSSTTFDDGKGLIAYARKRVVCRCVKSGCFPWPKSPPSTRTDTLWGTPWAPHRSWKAENVALPSIGTRECSCRKTRRFPFQTGYDRARQFPATESEGIDDSGASGKFESRRTFRWCSLGAALQDDTRLRSQAGRTHACHRASRGLPDGRSGFLPKRNACVCIPSSRGQNVEL